MSPVVVDSAPIEDGYNSTIPCDAQKHGVQICEKPHRSPLIELVHPLQVLLDAWSFGAPKEETAMTAGVNTTIGETPKGSGVTWTFSRRAVSLSLLALLAIVMGPFPALAGQRTRRPVAPNSDATLYEVSETVHFDSAAGLSVTMRNAIATLLGSANLGTPLCPAAVLAMNPAATSCDIAGQGQDSVSLATGLGPVWGTFAVLINAPGNSDDHIPDLPVLTGTFTGDVDLSPAVQSQIPLGYLRNGQLTVDQTGQVISFSGTFRLPFSQVDAMGLKRDYYLAADGTPIPVRQHERDLGFPLVRLEVTFGQ